MSSVKVSEGGEEEEGMVSRGGSYAPSPGIAPSIGKIKLLKSYTDYSVLAKLIVTALPDLHNNQVLCHKSIL